MSLLDKGMEPDMARLTGRGGFEQTLEIVIVIFIQTALARKIAAIALTLWKKEKRFDAEQLKTQAARAFHRTQVISQVYPPGPGRPATQIS